MWRHDVQLPTDPGDSVSQIILVGGRQTATLFLDNGCVEEAAHCPREASEWGELLKPHPHVAERLAATS